MRRSETLGDHAGGESGREASKPTHARPLESCGRDDETGTFATKRRRFYVVEALTTLRGSEMTRTITEAFPRPLADTLVADRGGWRDPWVES